ncbi:LOW QUALITY PROTEIN: HDHD2-like protein, partial [Mya arenaria]
MREKKTRVKFVTNTTKESKRVLLDRLHHIGFQVTADEVFTSLTAARNLVASRGLPEGPTNAVVVGLAPDNMDASMKLSGPFVTGLEYAADCKAEVVGKPEAAFFLSAIEGMDVRPEECLMIG